MHHTNTHHRRHRVLPAAAIAALLLACLGLAACGGGSSSTSTSTVAANTAPAAKSGTSTTGTSTTGTGTTTSAQNTPPGPGASASGTPGAGSPGAGRFAAVRECLAKSGITLPKRTPGQRPGPGGFSGGANGGPQLPKGMTREQFAAALRKCGGGVRVGRKGFFNSPAYRQALTSFATCMRQNGVNLPSPNGSGTGPVFDTKGINTASAQFKAAEMKCQSILRSAFPRRAGAGSAGGGA
jgi:hypothetical protein